MLKFYFILSPYSPAFNPIENVFGLIESRLDKIRLRANTRHLLKNYIKIVVEGINEQGSSLIQPLYNKMWGNVNRSFNGIND